MTTRELELELERAFRRGVKRCQKLGYNPTYFVRMLDEHRAVVAARQLLAAPAISEGFSQLWELGHLELTVEAIVLEDRFRPLFRASELDVARKRLADLGYVPS
jgi:hypothetical protein